MSRRRGKRGARNAPRTRASEHPAPAAESPGHGDDEAHSHLEAVASQPSSWVPEFPGQRPPFPPGNTLSIRHGAYSPRRVNPLAQELVDRTLSDPATGYLQAPAWRAALWAWARAEAEVQLLDEHIARLGEQAENGIGDLADDAVRSAHLLKHRAETRATTQRTRLGLDPLSAARLGRDKTAAAVDAAQLMKTLADAERRRGREEAGDDDED